MSSLLIWRFGASLSLFLFLGMIGGCASIKTGSHLDETTDFGAYQSFSWIDDTPYITADEAAPVSALAQEKIKSAIQQQLVAKGYEFVDDRDAADFVVGFTVGTRDKIRIESYPDHYRGSWGWHVPFSAYYYRDVSVHHYTRGTLGVDIFDNETGKPVWHGWAEKTVTESDRADPGPAIEQGAALLFASFPH